MAEIRATARKPPLSHESYTHSEQAGITIVGARD